MKRILLLASFLMGLTFGLDAQLAPGTKLPANIVGTDYNTGEAVDVQAWLDDGKAVIVDVFATWCGPCYGYHLSGYLEGLYEEYGPEGTDQIRILAVEADPQTAENAIETNQFGAPGSWITNPATGEPIAYNIMNENSGAGVANMLGLGYWPSVYIIQPSGSLLEVLDMQINQGFADQRYSQEFFESVLGVGEENQIGLSGENIALGSFCGEVSFPGQSVRFLNTTSETITSADITLTANGEVLQTNEFTGSVEPLNFSSFTLSGQSFDETTEVTLEISNINGQGGVNYRNRAFADKFELNTREFTVLFTTDNFPTETSWTLVDQDGNPLFFVNSYNGDPDGGGADANRTFEYDVNIGESVSCLEFSITDRFGDGMSSFDPTMNPIPGVEIRDANGVLIKDNKILTNGSEIDRITGESNGGFGEGIDALTVEIGVDLTSNVNEIDQLEAINIFPNPASASVNVELNFTQDIDYTISVMDSYGKTVSYLGNYSNNGLTKNFDISDLSSGMYFLSISSENGQNMTKFTKI